MSTVRSIERRLYVRRQTDRDFASAAAGVAPASRGNEWGGIWVGYVSFAGVALLLTSLVFGIGFSSLDPLNASSWMHAGTGTLIWCGIMLFVAIFCGALASARYSRGNPFGKAVALWGLVALSVLFLTGWIAGTAAQVAGPALGAVAGNSGAGLQASLRANGIILTAPQANAISARITAGDLPGAATALSQDAGLSNADAIAVINRAAPAATPSNSTGNFAQSARSGGSGFAWGIFWFTLIGFFCAWAGALIGNGAGPRRISNPTRQAA